MNYIRVHIFYISHQVNVIGCWADLGIDQGQPSLETDVLSIRPRELLGDVILCIYILYF